MQVNDSGYDFRHPKDFRINRPHGSGDMIFLVIRSESFIYLAGEKRQMPAGSAFVFERGSPQIYGAEGEEFINDWVHFDLDAEDRDWFENLGIPLDTVLTPIDTHPLSSFIKSIAREKYSSAPHREESMILYLRLLFIKLSELISCPKELCRIPYFSRLSALRSDIYSRPYEDWSIDKISASLGLSRSYLQHLYKQSFGGGIIHDVLTARLDHAKYLLGTDPDAKIADIAGQCGFRDELHFMRSFKARFSLTPSEYRASLSYG